jgi:uncharacterized iron-regulated membrane protein
VPFRKILFWLHLSVGIAAGAIILLMAVTGVLLTYEKQMIYWADTRGLDVAATGNRLQLAEVIGPHEAMGITIRQGDRDPVFLQLDGGKIAWVDPYSGATLGTGNQPVRNFFRTTMELHRWLAASGESRATGRAITGACNLAFLGLVFTGAYLWIPKALTSKYLRPIVWFRSGLSGKARDFNWHNVIGVWCFLPLAVIVASGAMISYKWAGDLVYRAAGDTPPPPSKPVPPPTALDAAAAQRAFDVAAASTPDWKSITLRDAGGNLSATVDRGYPGQPQLRTTLTIDAASGAILKTESFSDLSPGRRARFWLRFLHTGESFGLAGQTVAGIVSLGASFLVWTGIALSWRRFRAWQARRAASQLELDALSQR